MNKQNQIEYFHSIVGPRIDCYFILLRKISALFPDDTDYV